MVDPRVCEGSERRTELDVAVAAGVCLLAESGSDDLPTVVGYVTVAPRHFFGRDLVTLLVVAESWRRRGVGTRLLDAAVGRATTAAVFTSTNESNHAMRSLLVHEGWLVSGRLDGLDEGDPELVFYRRA